MKNMTVTEFKTHALKILGEVAANKESILVTKCRKPLTEITPYTESRPEPGRLADAYVFEEDIVSLLGASMWNASK